MAQLLEVSVKVIQARHLQVDANSSTQVEVNIGDKYKYTKVVKFSDAPFFDEYFTFDYKLDLEDVLEKTVKFKVKKSRGLLSKVTIADFSLSLRDVWAQPGHHIFRKWAPLLHPANLAAGSQGFLKLDIRILKAGEMAPIPVQLDQEDEDIIEENMILQREGGVPHDRQYAEYIVHVYCADGIPKLPSSVLGQLWHAMSGEKSRDTINPVIGIRISDLEGRTTAQNTKSPVWNESVTFTEIFPPMWSNVRVQLSSYSSLGSTILAEHCIPLSAISHLSLNENNNFPPSFGPAFIHLYSEPGKYAGRVLLSISTKILDLELLDEPPTRKVMLSSCEPLPENQKATGVKMALFVSLLDASMLRSDLVGHKLIFQACFGSPFAPQGSVGSSSVLMARAGDEGLGVLPAGETAPCASCTGTWPDRRHSMFTKNRFLRLAEYLESSHNSEGIVVRARQTLEKFVDLAARTIASLRGPDSLCSDEHATRLDSLRATVHKASLEEMVVSARQAATNGSEEEQSKLVEILSNRARKLAYDPQQGGMPMVNLRLVTEGEKLLAELGLNPEDLIYTLVEGETGLSCLKPTTVFLKAEGSAAAWDAAAVAKLRIFSWLGLAREVPACLQKMPVSCIRKQDVGSLFPSALQFTQKNVFECRAHVYQGSFIAGWDKSSLADPFVRVTVADKTCCTKVIHETLSPTWDQTLVLWPVIIWGTVEAVTNNPPLVVMEALDMDVGKSPDFIGCTTTTPIVKLLMSHESARAPSLKWFTMRRGIRTVATILAAFELVQRSSDDEEPPTPLAIRPRLRLYRLECLFWGVRGQSRCERPRIRVECAGHEVCSSIIADVLQYSNFDNPHCWLELELPDNYLYLPPLTIKLFSHRNLVQPVFEGTCMVPSLQPFLEAAPMKRRQAMRVSISLDELGSMRDSTAIQVETDPDEGSDTSPLIPKRKSLQDNKRGKSQKNLPIGFENVELDWWSKLYASESKMRATAVVNNNPELSAITIKLYDRELEVQPEFRGFMDLVRVFPLVKGHRSMDDDPPVVANFKGGFSLRPLLPSQDPESESMALLPPRLMVPQAPQQQVKVLARIYVVRGVRLRPKDIDGLSDPYITVNTILGQRIKDRENYVKGSLNPDFGRCYELELSLPKEHEIIVGVVDRDDSTSDDIIGETRIDVERRLMSCHRAHCGISRRYDRTGYNAWRDGELPSQILAGLCARHNIPPPVIVGSQITVGALTLHASVETSEEQLSLAVLLRWQEVAGWPLVPEHIESRPLFLPRKPGVEQGQLHMWLDLFPERGCAPGPPVNIAPRMPVAYELRVIVWNAEEIPLDDTSVVGGEHMSDIFFKCWLGEPTDQQVTDIHYRSLTGEGQFNWRMIFPLQYLAAERRMVVERHGLAGLFSRGKHLIPCSLSVQVWDADLISADDFIGSTCIDLSRLPPGAKTARTCMLSGAEAGPPLNLFVMQRTRGWWPLRNVQGGPAGKVELELELIKAELAAEHPVGQGREPPEPLPAPTRPDTSFLWLLNPVRSFRGILWRQYARKFMCFLLLAIVLLMLLSALFAIPELLVKKLFTFWI